MVVSISLLVALLIGCSTVQLEDPFKEAKRELYIKCSLYPQYYGYITTREGYSFLKKYGISISTTPFEYCKSLSRRAFK